MIFPLPSCRQYAAPPRCLVQLALTGTCKVVLQVLHQKSFDTVSVIKCTIKRMSAIKFNQSVNQIYICKGFLKGLLSKPPLCFRARWSYDRPQGSACGTRAQRKGCGVCSADSRGYSSKIIKLLLGKEFRFITKRQLSQKLCVLQLSPWLFTSAQAPGFLLIFLPVGENDRGQVGCWRELCFMAFQASFSSSGQQRVGPWLERCRSPLGAGVQCQALLRMWDPQGRALGPRFSVRSRTWHVSTRQPASAGLSGLGKGCVLGMDAPGAKKAPSTSSGNLKKRLPNT